MSDKAKEMAAKRASSPSKTDLDDEYIDDEFDIEDESGSLQQTSGPQIVNNLKDKGSTLVDFNVSASASLLPPLAGGTIKAPEGYNSQVSKQPKTS